MKEDEQLPEWPASWQRPHNPAWPNIREVMKPCGVERVEMSVSQFAELVGVEPSRLIAVEKRGGVLVLVLEPEVINGGDDGGILPPIAERREDRGETQGRRTQSDHGIDGHGQKEDRVRLDG